jgi:two-component system nitrate/nitrite response regulator NarL
LNFSNNRPKPTAKTIVRLQRKGQSVRVRVCLFGVQPLLLESMFRVLADQYEVCECQLGFTQAADIVARLAPDLVVIDCGGLDRGIGTTRLIRQAAPKTRIAVLSGRQSASHAIACLDAGANGYICLSATAEELRNALDLVTNGETFISPRLASSVIATVQKAALAERAAFNQRLTHRETQIARLLVQGYTNREIGRQLSLAEKTVKHYMTVMMQKFDSRNRVELATTLPQHLGSTVPQMAMGE